MLGISAPAQVVSHALQQFIIDRATNKLPVGHFRFTTISSRNKGINARAINAHLEHHGLDQRVKIFFADNAGEHESHDMRNSSRSSTSSTFRQLLAASIKMRSLSMLASGAWATQFYCASLNAQRHNNLPHSALNGTSPFPILLRKTIRASHISPTARRACVVSS